MEMRVVDTSSEVGIVEKIQTAHSKYYFTKKLPQFYRQYAGALRGGKTSIEIFRDMANIARGNKNPAAGLYERMHKKVGAGEEVSSVISEYIPDLDRTLFAPASNNEEALLNSLSIAEKVASSRERLSRLGFSKLMGPLGQLFSITSAVVFMGSSLFPDILANVKDAGAKGDQGLMIFVRDFSLFATRNYVWFAIIAFALFAFSMYSKTRMKKSTLRTFLDHIPPWSFYRVQQGGNFVVSFAALIATGQAPTEGLLAMIQSANPYLQSHLKDMFSAIHEGKELHVALKTGLIPPVILDEISIRSTPSNIQAVMKDLGLERMDELEHLIETSIVRIASAITYTAYAVGAVGALAFIQMYAIMTSVSTN